jgi:multicomponent Na+:H+ antiporter subunit G
MDILIYYTSWLLLLCGAFFCAVGGLGILRLPDFYSRQHAAGITDTLGAALLLIGLILQAGLSLVGIKLVMILLFLLFTSPVATHTIAQAALQSGLKPKLAEKERDG